MSESHLWDCPVLGDFPGCPVVKDLPSNAVDAGSISGQRAKIPHSVGQLSLGVTTIEPMGSGAH